MYQQISSIAAVTKQKMRSALRKLCKDGIEALRPQKVNDKWRKPVISKRVAADLRKAAIRNGTYGKFDSETGIGWDPLWDTPDRNKKQRKIDSLLVLSGNEPGDTTANLLVGSNPGSIQSIRPPKGHKRERTRESRAQKIEKLLEQADDKIEEYRLEKESKKPGEGIEEEFKQMNKNSGW